VALELSILGPLEARDDRPVVLGGRRRILGIRRVIEGD
jgi:hypothetical protein